ncbi:PREDICTED: protein indeterminate-domain 7-like isoform X1 [Fragaria vesca subsp. vesca]|uniref:protein indeterminate-domain 7-like isoform X1 n=1 Tax=Fragaria vesca subsp. vesca TaxID=101020 RepID=UPI0002C3110D|nr:PREDICTED: protein indeterminate-domain 7-like isoform X1 [Fragaria vesca subsp. vesca]
MQPPNYQQGANPLIMMKGFAVDENMSNLTCASGDLSASANSSIRNDSSSSTHQQQPAQKKKRNLPGNPDPDAEVIALSPKSLMATNRFICEVCNKGFQREQNLQLHRRGHNLPWKLKQRTNKEVKKKVYLCPEPTCVHHDPSRALGDLTGIKKHFSRKHGEKKWKCEKCSKRYAVQSDWKAHSKICGTREYRCDCGTLFSRRDSFITHRAFCDALAQENSNAARAINPLLSSSSLPQLHGGFQPHHHLSHHHVKREVQDLQLQLPPWMGGEAATSAGPSHHLSSNINLSSSSPLFSTSSFDQHQSFLHQNPNPSSSDFQPSGASAHMSATALLQKASEMGATVSKPSSMFLKPHDQQQQHQASHMMPETTAFSSFMEGNSGGPTNNSLLHDMMMMTSHMQQSSSAAHGGFDQLSSSSSFGDQHHQGFNGSMVMGSFGENVNPPPQKKLITAEAQLRRTGSTTDGGGRGGGGGGGGMNEGMTRDFLGLRGFSSQDDQDFFDMAAAHGLDQHVVNSTSSANYNGQQHNNQNQTSWPGN